ncbi:MAG: hypothetical protein ACRDRL_28575, partial [Sciscionella sp.]
MSDRVLTAAQQPSLPSSCAQAQYFEFGKLDPDEVSKRGSRSWFVRTQSFAVAYTQVVDSECIERRNQPDEYVVLLASDDLSLEITTAAGEVTVRGQSVVIIPPGHSALRVQGGGEIVRLFSLRSPDVLARCRNAAVYDRPDPNVAPYRPWPTPTGAPQPRIYPVGAVEPDPDRFGRIYRCSTLMVNYMYPEDGPRDDTSLTPHAHDDFEQCSLTLCGDYVHHVRTPWTPRLADWRDDEHVLCS